MQWVLAMLLHYSSDIYPLIGLLGNTLAFVLRGKGTTFLQKLSQECFKWSYNGKWPITNQTHHLTKFIWDSLTQLHVSDDEEYMQTHSVLIL